MKILFYSDPCKVVGGAETYWRETCRFLEASGVELRQLTPDEASPLQNVRAEIKRFKPDLIHLNKNVRYARKMYHLLQGARLPVVATVHDYHSIPFPTTFRNKLKTQWYRHRRYAHAFVIPSLDYFNFLSQHQIDNICFIPHFVDPEKWRFNTNYAADSGRLLFVGRLERQKGIWVLLEAFKQLLREDPSLTLNIIGTGREQNKIEHYLLRNQLGHQVTLAGEKNAAEVLHYFHNAALLVVPSVQQEMLGLVGLEAQAAGLPVIASDICGIREWCCHAKSGWVVPPGAPRRLATEIHRLLSAAGLRRQLRENALNQVLREYSVAQSVAQLTDLYKRLINTGYK